MPQDSQYVVDLLSLLCCPRGYHWTGASAECRFLQEWASQNFDLIVSM